jgi:radical SAM protein with 4Fe4S-binding SPASM domain
MSYPDNRAVANWVSYTCLDGEFWLIDHRTDGLMKLNRTASEVFRKLISGTPIDADERSFAESALAGVIALDGAPPEGDPVPAPPNAEPYEAFRHLREFALCKCLPLCASLELTYRCNTDCIHCYRPRSDAAMPVERWKSLLGELKEMGCLSLALTGGEPLVWPHFRELVSHVRSLRMSFLVKTNGWLLDESLGEFLARHYVSEVHVSLYGGSPATHDAVTRLAGSFDRACRAIALLVSHGIPVQISGILTRSTWTEYEAVTRIADEFDVGVGFNPVLMPSAAGEVDHKSLRMTAEQIASFCSETIGGEAGLKVVRFPGHPICSAARSNCSIAPDGNVYPCNGYWYGTVTQSVLEKPFAEVWQNSPILRQVRQLTNADLVRCSACSHFEHCPRCPGMGHAETGRLDGVAPGDCLYARAFHEACQTQRPAVLVGQAGSFGSRC